MRHDGLRLRGSDRAVPYDATGEHPPVAHLPGLRRAVSIRTIRHPSGVSTVYAMSPNPATNTSSTSGEQPPGRLGLSPLAIISLAALGAPRVVLHDLGMTEEGFGLISAVLTIVPVAIWVLVLVAKRAHATVITGAVIGALYGVLLAGIHQLLWNEAFEDDPPRLGGNLEDRFSAGTEELILRLASIPSSLGVGLGLGVIAGLVAKYLITHQRQ